MDICLIRSVGNWEIDSRLSRLYLLSMSKDSNRTVKGELVTELILVVFPLNGRLLAAGNELGSSVGLTSALWQVLGALKDNPRTVAQIGRAMGLARQSVQRSVNIMEQNGLVKLVRNPDHKTSPLVQLTKEGEAAYRRVMRKQANWANDLANHLKADELKIAIKVLRSVVATLETDN